MKRLVPHRGFSIWELLVVIAMLGVAGLITSRMFVASIHAIRTAPHPQEQQIKLDRMLCALRQDVWSADHIEVNGKTVALSGGGQKIQWTFDKLSATRALEGATPEAGTDQWTLPFPVEARADGASLILVNVAAPPETPHGPRTPNESRRFVSQVLLTAEAK